MDNEIIVPTLGRCFQFGYSVGHFLNDVTASMWFTYFLVFFHVVLEFSASQAGILMLIGQVVDALATPFVGYDSDHTDNFISNIYGKRKLWHLFGTVCTLLSFPFIFTECVGCSNSHKWAQMYYYAVFITIFQIGWAIVQVNHLSLIPELSDSEQTMTHLTAIRYGCTVFSNLFVYIITLTVLHIGGDCDNQQVGPGDEKKFSLVTYISLGVGFAAVVIFHSLVKEPSRSDSGQLYIITSNSSHIDLFKEGALYQVGGVYMCSRLVVNICQAFVPLYTHRSLQLPARAIALAPLALYGGALAGATAARLMPTSAKAAYRYLPGAVVCASSGLAIFFCRGYLYNRYFLYLLVFTLGMGGAWLLVVAQALCAELIGTRTHASAFVYGLMSFTDKISTGIAIFLIQHFSENSSAAYYKDVLTTATLMASSLGLIFALIPTKVTSRSQEATASAVDERTSLLSSNQS